MSPQHPPELCLSNPGYDVPATQDNKDYIKQPLLIEEELALFEIFLHRGMETHTTHGDQNKQCDLKLSNASELLLHSVCNWCATR